MRGTDETKGYDVSQLIDGERFNMGLDLTWPEALAICRTEAGNAAQACVTQPYNRERWPVAKPS